MKAKKFIKPLLFSAMCIMLVVATMFATMAYMTSTATVTNVFTVGDVKLHMFETKVDKYGESLNEPLKDGMKTADANSYHLLPGKTYLKDPTIYVEKDSESSYLFVRLRNDLKHIEWENVPVTNNDTTTPVDGEEQPETVGIPEKRDAIVTQMKKNGWLEIWRAETNIDAVFVYVGEDTSALAGQIDDTYKTEAEVFFTKLNKKAVLVGGVDERKSYDLFHYFTLANKVDNLQLFAGASVVIRAYAIQSSLPGFDTEDAYGTAPAVQSAWEYIRNELPFAD